MEVENQLAPASPNLPQVAVAEPAAMPALQAIAAAPDREEEEENLQIMIQLAPASPILPRVAVAESAVMPPLQAIAAAYATDS